MVRFLCSFLVILAFILGTMIPASQQVGAQDAPVSSVEHSMPVDCDQGDDNATPPMPCGKVFCAGMALILPPAQEAPDLLAATYDLASDQNGVGLSRFPDPDPPRTTSVN